MADQFRVSGLVSVTVDDREIDEAVERSRRRRETRERGGGPIIAPPPRNAAAVGCSPGSAVVSAAAFSASSGIGRLRSDAARGAATGAAAALAAKPNQASVSALGVASVTRATAAVRQLTGRLDRVSERLSEGGGGSVASAAGVGLAARGIGRGALTGALVPGGAIAAGLGANLVLGRIALELAKLPARITAAADSRVADVVSARGAEFSGALSAVSVGRELRDITRAQTVGSLRGASLRRLDRVAGGVGDDLNRAGAVLGAFGDQVLADLLEQVRPFTQAMQGVAYAVPHAVNGLLQAIDSIRGIDISYRVPTTTGAPTRLGPGFQTTLPIGSGPGVVDPFAPGASQI